MDDSKKEYLFSLNINNKQYLKDTEIDGQLRKIFKDNKISLSNSASISKIDNNTWEINDEVCTYRIEYVTKELKVYRDTELEFKGITFVYITVFFLPYDYQDLSNKIESKKFNDLGFKYKKPEDFRKELDDSAFSGAIYNYILENVKTLQVDSNNKTIKNFEKNRLNIGANEIKFFPWGVMTIKTELGFDEKFKIKTDDCIHLLNTAIYRDVKLLQNNLKKSVFESLDKLSAKPSDFDVDEEHA